MPNNSSITLHADGRVQNLAGMNLSLSDEYFGHTNKMCINFRNHMSLRKKDSRSFPVLFLEKTHHVSILLGSFSERRFDSQQVLRKCMR